MALYGTLQLSHGMGLCRNQGGYKPDYSVMRRRLHISKVPLSLGVRFGQQGFSNILLSDYLHRPICSVPCRTTAFRCHSFSVGGNAIEPAVKAVTVVLTRSQGLIQQFPLVYKLVPAVALLGFSLWGLVPFVRQGRNLLLNKNDNGWKKSGTYHVMTSYVQPLLLWLGALFICSSPQNLNLNHDGSTIVLLLPLNPISISIPFYLHQSLRSPSIFSISIFSVIERESYNAANSPISIFSVSHLQVYSPAQNSSKRVCCNDEQ